MALVFGALALSPWLEDDNGSRRRRSRSPSCARSNGFALPTVVAMLLIRLIVTGDQQRCEPRRRPRRAGHRRVDDGLRRLHAGQHLAEQPVLPSSSLDPDRDLCYNVRDPLDLAVIAAAITGACFGFLWWNASPAAIFMGDTGSLSLGGALAGLAILTRTELLLVILGGLFVLITISVMLQVGCFKASRTADRQRAAGSSGSRRSSTTSRSSAGSRSPS